MIFELFRTFKSPKFFRPAAEKILGTNKGGFLIKGGFLNINTPDFKTNRITAELIAPQAQFQSVRGLGRSSPDAVRVECVLWVHRS